MGVLENASLIPIQELYYKSSFPLTMKKNKEKDNSTLNRGENQIINENTNDNILDKLKNECQDKDNLNVGYQEECGEPIKMDKFPVVIISHSLAAHCNAYTLFAKELASKGYIVFSMEHIEEIKNPYMDREQNR